MWLDDQAAAFDGPGLPFVEIGRVRLPALLILILLILSILLLLILSLLLLLPLLSRWRLLVRLLGIGLLRGLSEGFLCRSLEPEQARKGHDAFQGMAMNTTNHEVLHQ